MTVISFVNQKGGCGKSTLAVHLAWWLQSQDYAVGLIDSDGQQSASRWVNFIKEESPCNLESFVIADGTELLERIPVIAQDFDFCVIDGGGMLSDLTLNILLRSDLALIPVQPTGLDLASTNEALKIAKQVQSVRNGKPEIRLILSRAISKTRLLTEAKTLLKKQGLLKTVIFQRQAIADCFGQGAVVWTLPGESSTSKACTEFGSLCKEILDAVEALEDD